ncbi:MAG TPA: DUF1707 domain-containing protein [Gemmatimonadota bacterium]|nr:DUF1707 domain-containing protein [Gemmatimonadota bacterium]
MDESTPPPARMPLEHRRERTIRDLTRHFSRDHLSVEELEQRLDAAIAAPDQAALEDLVRDLPALPAEQEPVAFGPRVEPGVSAAEHGFVVAILSGSSRKGAWTPPRKLRALAVMGGAEIDFREARFGAAVVEVEAFALMGGVEIIVPPGVRVEAHGLGIMGGFDDGSSNAEIDPAAPLVRVRGLALMGGISVEIRLPGESEREARKRLRRSRREKRREIEP